MAEGSPSPTISLRERSFPTQGSEERLPKWLLYSFILHGAFVAGLFLTPLLPSRVRPDAPVYVVDLVGGDKIGGMKLGTEMPAAKRAKTPEPEPVAPARETKTESKKEPLEKAKAIEKKPVEEKVVLKEKTKVEPNSLWMGSPGKFRRHLDEKDQEMILMYAENYLGYKESYLAERK